MKSRHSDAVTQTADRKRLLLLGMGIFFLFTILIVQFFRIQIVEGERWTRIAEGQHYFHVHEPFQRGVFYSNNELRPGHPSAEQALVVDIQKFHLFADPYSVPEDCCDELAASLVKFLHLADEEKQQLRKQFDYRRSRSRRLVMWLDRESRDIIREWWFRYAKEHGIARNALYFISDYQRSYPYGHLAGQILHTIRERKEEKTKQGLPTGGLEASFNDYLKGKLGKRRLLRSPRNSFALGDVVEAPEHGANVHLSIDAYLQAIAEEEIAIGVEKAGAKSGWAVMMNPHTGEIYALAQYPFFSPANYQEFFNNPEKIADTTVKAVTYAFEPGSTMKPLTLAAALEANQELARRNQPPLFTPEEKFAVQNGSFPGRSRPIIDTHPCKYVNMYMGLQKSSNIYMGRLVDRIVKKLGNEWYRGLLKDSLGLGLKTGIEVPAESPGLLPTPGKMHPNGTLEWSTPTPYSLAIGYNLQVNSLQMMRAWACIANGGYLVSPTLIRQVKRPNEPPLLDKQNPERLESFPRVLSANTVDEVLKALKYVSHGGGSGRRGNIPGYTEASKTGTTRKIVNGQYTKKKHFATFIGFTPVENPAFLLLVAMDEPELTRGRLYGGVSAAPVFKAIAQKSLEYLGVAPDDPHGFPKGDPRHDPEKADWVKETQALERLYQSWNYEAKKAL